MDWHCLGHATWLAEVDGLRLLFDPLLEDLHHGGVFEVFPPRVINVDALRPDFVFVSHRHPDHFDLKSLRRLAAVDPEIVLVTSDDLVARCAKRLGFKTTRVVPPETTVDLDGPHIVTTPSRGAIDPEWGIVVANQEGAVYNQVDTVIGDPSSIRAFFERVANALHRTVPTDVNHEDHLITLALARWQPLLEVDAMMAGSIGFPFHAYSDELAQCAAINARVVVPSAAGTRHTGSHAFMNRLVYPVSEDQFIEDARHVGISRVEPCTTGATYRVRAGDVIIDRHGATDLVIATHPAPIDPRVFRPLEIPPMVDPHANPRIKESELRDRVDAWVSGVLAPTLVKKGTLRYVLEVVFPSGAIEVRTIIHGRVTRHDDDARWDVRCVVAASLLVEVIDGHRHWGDVLLGGMLRGCSRAYEIDSEKRLRPVALQPLFVYEAVSYEESVVRALESELLT